MIKYKHKETGLYLTKRKSAYVAVYKLTGKGTVWAHDCIKTMSLRKEGFVEGFFSPDEFEKETYTLTFGKNENN